jgi:signal transduction histidine kinase
LVDPNFELNRFIIRIVYLAVVAVLIGYLGAHEQKLRTDVSNLADWPHFLPAELKALLQEMLKKVATILDAPCIVLAWEAEEEPWLHLASWRGGQFHYSREAPAVFGTLVAEPLAGSNFLCANARSPRPTVVHNSPDGFQRWRGSPLHPQMVTRFNPKSVLGLRLHGKNQEGYLFAFEKRGITSDELVLGAIVSSGVSVRLDNFFLLKQLLGAAATEERVRLARDLHDGLLQSLTGAALQMEAARRLMETDPQAAQKLLMEIQQLIAAEQQDLRLHIRELKPSVPNFREKDSALAPRLENLAERIKRHWGLQVDVRLSHDVAQIPSSLAWEIYFIVHESLINAARHANASIVRAELGVMDDRVNITVSDDGHGFPFRGRYDHAALTKNGIGPANLKERIASLGGSLVLNSSDSGTRLEITVPIRETEV